MKPRYWLGAGLCVLLGLMVYFLAFGYQFSALLLWLAAAGILAFGLVDALRGRFPRSMKWLRRAMLLCLCLLLAAMAATSVWIGTCAAGAEDPEAEAIIVLGAGVNGTVPSMSLRERLDAALAYLEEYPAAVAVLSGARGGGEDITEAQCMFDWLTARGVAPERLLREEQATSTQENLRYSLALLESYFGVRPKTVAVVSSEYHLCRAELYADRLGAKALGVPAHTTYMTLRINYQVREIFGVWVALLKK